MDPLSKGWRCRTDNPLCSPLQEGHTDTIRTLLSLGADLEAKDGKGRSGKLLAHPPCITARGTPELSGAASFVYANGSWCSLTCQNPFFLIFFIFFFQKGSRLPAFLMSNRVFEPAVLGPSPCGKKLQHSSGLFSARLLILHEALISLIPLISPNISQKSKLSQNEAVQG